MKGTVLYRPGDIRFEDRETPKIIEPTDAVLRLAATCVCGSDLWPYRGLQPIDGPTPMGHEYCGFVEEVGSAVKSVKPGQFVVGSFATSAVAATKEVGVRQTRKAPPLRAEFADVADEGDLVKFGMVHFPRRSLESRGGAPA